MTTLWDLFDADVLQDEIRAGYVKANRHPTLPLTIYTYTREAQYEGHWNDVTKLCRGLVADDDGYVIARPLPKFFNYGEHGTRDYAPSLPLEPFRVYDKMDGSLGIVFNWRNTGWTAASKGSFISDQAQWAQARLAKSDTKYLNPYLTYCCELIYPDNRIVVDYGKREDMVLLAVSTPDGREFDPEGSSAMWGPIGSVVQHHGMNDDPHKFVNEIDHSVRGTDAEGYVLRFESGVRVKAKFSQYLHLHKLLTGISERDIWRALAFDELIASNVSHAQILSTLKCAPEQVYAMDGARGTAMENLIEGAPDEFDKFVKGVVKSLTDDYVRLAREHVNLFLDIEAKSNGRAEFARNLTASTNNKTIMAACFARLDNKPVEPLLWKALYPKTSNTFKNDEDG